jgi:hypothetical protein
VVLRFSAAQILLMKELGVLATAARIGILVLSTAIALRQMGIANEIIELAFGLGGRDVGRQADRAVARQRQECLAALG